VHLEELYLSHNGIETIANVFHLVGAFTRASSLWCLLTLIGFLHRPT
jgi:hypothetical protein